jgi:hypothetical protein
MKAFFISIMMILFSGALFSQQVRFGLDPGFALSRGDYRPHEGLDRRIFGGFDGGALLEIGVAPKFKLQPEVNYSIIGVELNDGEREATIKLRYVDVNLLAKLGLCKNLSLFAGPQVGFLTWAKRDSSFTNEMIDLKNDFKDYDYGLVFGAEYNFSKHVFLSGRYYHGLYQVAESSNDFVLRNRYISFRLGYIF